MGKVRLYALAKELNVSSGDLLEMLQKAGHEGLTASSSVDEAVADKLRASRPASAAPSTGHGTAHGKASPAPKATDAKHAAKPKIAKPAPAPAAPVLPPPPPIERRGKAIKPVRRTDLSQTEQAAVEERRRQRLARMRGEVAAGGAGGGDLEGELAAEAMHDYSEEPEAEAAPAEVPEAEVAAEPAPERLTLPHVVSPPPPRPPEPPPVIMESPRPQTAVEAVLSAASYTSAPPVVAPPATPTRTVREFRGPIRKIELPPQPSRSMPPMHGRPPGPQRPGGPSGPGGAPGRPPGGRPPAPRRRKNRDQPPPAPPVVVTPVKKGEGKTIRLTEGVTVKELAEKMDVKAKDIIQILLRRGVMVTVNVALDPELAKTLAEEFAFKPEVVTFEKDLQMQEEEQVLESLDFEGEEEPRPPIVTVMGHVDHGKTSLLDAIRKTNVAAGEAGGITQSIGAYQVDVHGRKVTFIDTPGHEAFTTMRSRGAQVTDLVILVVAASEGVMPQTVEAINHAKAAGVPIIVAMNKIDLPNARPDRIKTDLMAHQLVAEEFGGDVVFVPVSATKRQGIQELLEMVLLAADLRELKASPRRRAVGTVLEAGIDRGKGVVTSVIIQNGTLKPGDVLVAGAEWGRARAVWDDRGERIESAGPATPVQVTGLAGVPKAGDKFQVVEDEARAKEISEFRQHKRREAELAKSGVRGTLQDLSRAIAEGEQKELAVVIKADVHGAVEVLSKTITELSTPKVKTKIIHSGTGAITDSDVLLASASKAIIVGFNVRPERSAVGSPGTELEFAL